MDADCFETQPLVRWTLKCPNCGASASLPMEMTCSDHKSVMVPDTPPTRLGIIMPTRFRKAPGELRSMLSHSSRIFSKPRASE